MTNPKDPQADEQLNLLWDCFHPFDKAKTLDRWRTLVQAHQQQLLSELLGELPKKYKHNHHHDIQTQDGKYKCLNCRKTPDEIAGDDSMGNCPHFRSYNKALTDVVSVIERLQNKTNDGGQNE